ncbi:MAG TPA: amylo-alpha-1,6-glucosidase, partial [Bacteroidota bacterium]|nr:amylo-alpha-1,6-glucosidase [Bacteroidota bacterium]
DLRWTHDLWPTMTVKPECVGRLYTIGNARVQETIFGDRKLPCGAVHVHIDSMDPVEIVVSAKIDLRLMWPLSDAATGSLSYSWNETLRAFVIAAPHAGSCAVIGPSVPPAEYLGGQFSDIETSVDQLRGTPTPDTVVAISFRLRLPGGHSHIVISFAGSHLGQRDAERSYRSIATNPSSVLAKQARHVQRSASEFVQMETPDRAFNDAFRWAITSTERFSAEVPGLGRSLLAGYGTTGRGWNGGHENSGRPGYAWFFGRDSAWTSFALLGYGNYSAVRDVLEFLGDHQDPSGKIPHEVTTSGFAHYDAADSTPLYIMLMGRFLRSTGDKAFVRDQFDRLQKAVAFCFSTDTDGDHFIENTNVGHGWVEGGQLLPAHSEHYLVSCWAEALDEASSVASVLRRPALAKRWKAESKKVADTIEKEFWNEREQFYHFAKRADGSFNGEKTVLPAVGMSFGRGAYDHGLMCLDAYASAKFSTDWGIRIVGNDSRFFDPSGYHYGSVWPLFTGWVSLAEFRMGRPLQGYVHLMTNLLLHHQFAAGCIEEVYHGELFQPAGVCTRQAWSESMALQPVFDGMMGIEPDAVGNRVSLRPYFPPHWDRAALRNIPLGKRRIDLMMKRERGSTRFEFRISGGKPVQISFRPYFPLGCRISEILLNGKPHRAGTCVIRSYDDCPAVGFALSRKSVVEFVHADGVSLVSPVPRPAPMQPSSGIRVIHEAWERGKYRLVLEGRSGRTEIIELVDPDLTIRSVEGGTAITRENGRVRVEIEFDPGGRRDSYTKKDVTFHIND